MTLNFLKRPFIVLLTVPAFIASGIGLFPFLVIWIEHQFAAGTFSPYVLQIGPQSARTLLSVVAGGAMTALSLAYSLVLVVFTLAAGNIGPRLLKRFTSDLVNQVTAGIFGGTFLYALLTILFIREDYVPKATITLACVLAVLSVFQLIFFVRHVSKSVTIDDEIADITARLRESLKTEFGGDTSNGNEEVPDNFKHEIPSALSGYIGVIDIDGLRDLACKEDLVLRLELPRGAYVIKGQCILTTDKPLENDQIEKCLAMVRIEPSRPADNEIGFSTNLLVEIGLRALSPGVNDTFTALAAVDSLSGALSEIVAFDSKTAIARDDDDKLRLVQPGLSPARLIDQAFSPLRRASSENILMAEGLARALGRLFVKAGKEAEDELKQQTRLMFRDLKKSGQFADDIKRVGQYLPTELADSFR